LICSNRCNLRSLYEDQSQGVGRIQLEALAVDLRGGEARVSGGIEMLEPILIEFQSRRRGSGCEEDRLDIAGFVVDFGRLRIEPP
jgi:hypothetical protein